MTQVSAESWRAALCVRLTHGLGRMLESADLSSVAWNDADRTLTVHPPLLSELRARNIVSNVFRSRMLRR